MYSAYTKEQIKSFVTRFGDIIIKGITDQGLFFPAVVAQLTVESKWGVSVLSSKYNNYGGIKSTGSSFSNGTIKMDTTEVVGGKELPAKEPFATYPDFTNFMNDYVRVLHLPHFVSAGVFTATDPDAQILAIGKGGYSTRNPKEYLSFCEGRIDACLDLYPWGKIISTAPSPAEQKPTSFMASISATIGAALGNMNIKPAF